MGSGKTTVGRILSHLTGDVFVDLDEEIVRRSGMAIAQIFAMHGEEYCRQMESAILMELASKGGILALGGGAVIDAGSRKLIMKSGTVVYLRASAATLIGRLRDGSASRPLLASAVLDDFVPTMLRERSAVYEDAHLIIDTDSLTPRQVADLVINKMGRSIR